MSLRETVNMTFGELVYGCMRDFFDLVELNGGNAVGLCTELDDGDGAISVKFKLNDEGRFSYYVANFTWELYRDNAMQYQEMRLEDTELLVINRLSNLTGNQLRAQYHQLEARLAYRLRIAQLERTNKSLNDYIDHLEFVNNHL